VLLLLNDGQIAHGDCAAVQYAGVGGREPLFLAHPAADVIGRHIVPVLRGREITNFRDVAARSTRSWSKANVSTQPSGMASPRHFSTRRLELAA